MSSPSISDAKSSTMPLAPADQAVAPPVAEAPAPRAWPTRNPAINLLLADIVLQVGSELVQRGVATAFRSGEGPRAAAALVKPNRLARSVASKAIGTIGKKVVLPAAGAVGAALALKWLYDRQTKPKTASTNPPLDQVPPPDA